MIVPSKPYPVLGVFPALDCLGGVEASGRAAGEVLRRLGGPAARMFIYSAGKPSSVRAKFGAVADSLRSRGRTRLVLVWHLGLLKLVPFLVHGEAPVVLFLHGVEAWRRHDRLTMSMLRKVSLFLSNTEFTWLRFTEMHSEFASVPHRVVHLGLGEPISASSGGSLPDSPLAVMVGRMSSNERYKGHDEVIAAWPAVQDAVPGAQLWIAGPGDYREGLEGRVRALGLTSSVRFLGAIPEAAKQDLLARSRALLLPSRGEGFGLAYLEAMRLGRPCLTSTLDAGREVVNPPECGLAVDPGDLNALAGAVIRLLDYTGQWPVWSTSSRRRYEERFTEKHFQQRLTAALQEFA